MPPDRGRKEETRGQYRPRLVQASARRSEERPPTTKAEEPRFPPPLLETDVDAGCSAQHAIEQQAPRRPMFCSTIERNREVTERDHEHREAPPPTRRHQSEPGGHTGEVQEQESRVCPVLTQQDRCEEGAQCGGGSQRLHVYGVGDHG